MKKIIRLVIAFSIFYNVSAQEKSALAEGSQNIENNQKNVNNDVATSLPRLITDSNTDQKGLVIENPVSEEVKIYPNPVQDILNIDNSSGIKDVEIYNLQGQLVFFQHFNDFNSEEKILDLSQLQTGIYFMNLLKDNKKTSHKILKK